MKILVNFSIHLLNLHVLLLLQVHHLLLLLLQNLVFVLGFLLKISVNKIVKDMLLWKVVVNTKILVFGVFQLKNVC